MSITAALAAPVLSSLINAALKFYEAVQDGKINLDEAAKLIGSILDAGGKIAGLPKAERPVFAKWLSVICTSFAEAQRSHYPLLSMERSDQKDHEEQSAESITSALLGIQPPGAESPRKQVAQIDMLVGDVIEHPCFTELWDAFTKRTTAKNSWPVPLIAFDSEKPEDIDTRQRFNATFRAAYDDRLSHPSSQDIVRYKDEVLPRRRAPLVARALVEDMAAWTTRAVDGQGLTLANIYVEPRATLRPLPSWDSSTPHEVNSLVPRLLEVYPLLVITGDFGTGKSLTARRLAARYAEEWQQSRQRFRPIYIHCGELKPVDSLRLDSLTRAAQWHVQTLGLKQDDGALAMPSDAEPRIFLIDGLDELALPPRELTSFFQHLLGNATKNHSIVVFTRPSGIPEVWLTQLEAQRSKSERRVPVLRLNRFTAVGDDSQVAEWLRRWHRSRLESTDSVLDEEAVVQAAGADLARLTSDPRLLDLARTPLLLFMLAQLWRSSTWGVRPSVSDEPRGAGLGANPERAPQSDLYEQFIQEMVRGSLSAERAVDRRFAEALDILRSAPRVRELVRGDQSHGGEAERYGALAWLLSRIAWKSLELESRREPLDTHDITALLRDELMLAPENARTVCEVVVETPPLCLNPAPTSALGGALSVEFTHASFRDFLAARYWAHALRQKHPDSSLLGGRFLDPGYERLRFLKGLITAWTDAEKEALRRWAERCFRDERLAGLDASAREVTVLGEQWVYVREAALAICSELGGIEDRENRLRSLLGILWSKGVPPILYARNCKFPKANLAGMDLTKADFSGADLADCDLRGANLSGAILARVDSLVLAKLQRADLSSADLTDANLEGACLDGANLEATILSSANLNSARLANAWLLRAVLNNAHLRKADLTGSDLEGAFLHGAHLEGAQLRNALLLGAKLCDSYLEGADLEHARSLHDADLSGASYTDDEENAPENTRWPPNFNPQSAGATIRVI